MKEALGLIEAVGLAAAIEAADTCLKSANVKLIGYELTKGGGYVTIKISGDVGAVNAAVTAAAAAAMKVRGVYSTKVIPRPSEGLEAMVNSHETVGRVTDSVPQVLPESEAQAEETGTEEIPSSDEEAAEPDEELNEISALTESEALSEDTTCNICHNPACGRLKGEPRTKCMTYKR